ncbi:MAG: hypothetical protein P8175_03915 [Deltaproteobacteria bacterium]
MKTRNASKSSNAAPGNDDNSVRPGKFVVEPPTLINLGFEWYIEGDANHNAVVEVSYRKRGDTVWRDALPLLRIQNEQSIYAFPPTKVTDDWWTTPSYGATNNRIDYVTPNLFAGSILDLEPGTDYECKFLMSDPDGVRGEPLKVVTVRTRPEPKPFAGGKLYHVYPREHKGPREEPAFVNLMAAYYIGWCVADWGNIAPPRVQPGDTILIHGGIYKEDWTAYGSDINARPSGEGANFEGTYFLTQSGTPEKPVAIKAAGDGEVVFDGNGAFNLFNVMAGNYHYFEGLTIRNTDVAFWAGHKNIAGSRGLTVKRCRFENIGKGIHTDWSGSKNFYIADNVFIGRHNPYHVERWGDPEASNRFFAAGPFPVGPCLSEYAVKVAGSGHVICHNYVANFHDGIDHATYGVPDGYPAYGHPEVYPVEEVLKKDRMFVANDIYNNFITNMHDDFIEADGSMYNTRVLRNFCINAGTHGLSSQVLLGGPVYFIRNIVYHVPSAVKHHADPSGMIYYHNTFVARVFDANLDSSNYHFRNNLILGWLPSEPIFDATTYTNYSSSDYNGFCPNPEASYSFSWNSPPLDIQRDYSEPRIKRHFKTLAEYAQATGKDKHSILIDYDIFLDVKRPDVHNVIRVYKQEELDFRLHPNCAAVDAGCLLPNVNDDFTGAAPDLGALEAGRPLPVYGPRP